ncbi:MAG: DNA mismatch endonuclease Vsr [Verrucomicrobia bacterium]|nr:DNA mismatch endonuclease Vsr [Verrucomicrobiota bacterium]
MPDRVPPATRSRIMASVGQRDTGPEMALRRELHRLGYRFRTGRGSALPGRPDLIFPGRKKVIFVHGCFWHAHSCRWGRKPGSRLEYWGPKLAANRARDAKVVRRLRRSGWGVLTVWQCQLRDLQKTIARAARFLDQT